METIYLIKQLEEIGEYLTEDGVYNYPFEVVEAGEKLRNLLTVLKQEIAKD